MLHACVLDDMPDRVSVSVARGCPWVENGVVSAFGQWLEGA